MKHLILILLFLLLISKNAYSEMNNSKLLNNIFNGCIGKSKKVKPQKYIYCGCYTTKIGEKFTLDEFIKMSMNFSHLTKKQMTKEFVKNNKIISSIKECIEHL